MLSLPPLQLPVSAQAYIRGEVTIHPTAAIAPGVLLQAESDSQILIGAGVCIGMGAVLHAYGGKLEIEEGASLGAGVLLVGQGRIGAGACVGASTTVFNFSIQRGAIIPPGSLIGDTSRQLAAAPSTSGTVATEPSASTPQTLANAATQAPAQETAPTADNPVTSEAQPKSNSQIYGQAYVSELLVTLLPHRQPLNQSQPGLPAPPNDA